MGDFAAACAAVKTTLTAEWSTTPVIEVNETPADPWPPRSIDGNTLLPYVLCEVTGLPAEGFFGAPGNQVFREPGLIDLHVFVPVNSKVTTARSYAVQLGDIFRNRKFYDDGDGRIARGLAPWVDAGAIGSDDGAWFRVTATIPFEYWHRG